MTNTSKEYWEEFYKKHGTISNPTPFALYISENYISENDKIIDLGCGNGRDSVFFAEKNLQVTGVDQCEEEIINLGNLHNQNRLLEFIHGDFTNLDREKNFDHIYSRFTMHSINEEGENRVIEWAYNQLNKNGYFFIETRGQKNELYKLGEKVTNEDDAYIYENHYRRFINFDSLLNKLQKTGFEIIQAEEKPGFAPFKETDYIFIRMIGRKT